MAVAALFGQNEQGSASKTMAVTLDEYTYEAGV
jgi:hypothetical protein